MITIKPPKRKLNFVEIPQFVPYTFAFVTEKNELCHTPVKCRDFLQDALRSSFCGSEAAIYGFDYDKKLDHPICEKETRMVVYNISAKQMKIALQILHLFESDALMYKSYAEGTTQDEVYVFVSSKDWMSSPFSISLYTFLIRLAHREPKFSTKEEFVKCSQKIKTPRATNDNDAEYLKAIEPALWKITPNLKRISWKEVDYRKHHIHHFHNCSGIVSLARLRLNDKKWAAVVKEHIL